MNAGTRQPPATLMLTEQERDQTDQMVVTMAWMIEDGDFLAEGIGTFLPTAAYMLAKLTHAPHCTSLCPNGCSLMAGTRRLTLGHDEFDTVPRASMWLDYMQINTIHMPTILVGGRPRWTEFMRPAQLDPMGASNNVCIGPHDHPRVRLPGSAGIPDASTVARRFYYYSPRHNRKLFVPQLDFCSGAGHPDDQGGNPQQIAVITNLCVMSSGPGAALQVTHLHPGATREEIQDNTGFPVRWSPDLATTEPPGEQQMQLLDTEIDPQGLRYLEALSGAARKARLRALAAAQFDDPDSLTAP